MKVIVVAESHKGSHFSALEKLKSEGVKVELLSLQGDKGIRFTTKGYSVNYNLKKYLKRFDAVILGTDIDFQGTKIASILYHQLPDVKKIRLGFSEKGYVRLGGILPKRRLGMCLLLDRHNLIFASKVRRKFKLPNIGLGKALVIKAVNFLGKAGKKAVKVLNKLGTSTITAMVKGWFRGKSPEKVMQELTAMYEKGVIDYPRVDTNYIQETPYDIYPHKPFPSEAELIGDDFDIELLKPIEKEEIPLNSTTVLLELSNRRLITPASAVSVHKTITQMFTPNLKSKQEYTEVVEYINQNLTQDNEEKYISWLKAIFSPQLFLSPEFILDRATLEKLLELELDFENLVQKEELKKLLRKTQITKSQNDTFLMAKKRFKL